MLNSCSCDGFGILPTYLAAIGCVSSAQLKEMPRYCNNCPIGAVRTLYDQIHLVDPNYHSFKHWLQHYMLELQVDDTETV